MREVSDGFLLGIAEISAGFAGLFLVGVFFYVESGFRRSPVRAAFEPYLLASTRIVLVLFAITVGLSLCLIVLEMWWNRVIFAALSLLLVGTNAGTVWQMRSFRGIGKSPILLMTEVVGTASVVLIVVLPWALGGVEPSREDLTWAILISFAAAFLSVAATVLSVFDIERAEAALADSAQESKD
jgi:hypothetical protein